MSIPMINLNDPDMSGSGFFENVSFKAEKPKTQSMWQYLQSQRKERQKGGGKSSMSEKECEKAYDKILKRVEKDFGHSNITNSSELQSYCALRIPNFTSVEAYDRMPKLSDGQSAILNLDDHKGPGTHWVACLRDKKNLIVYDSFGRDSKQILSKLKTGGLKVKDTDYDAEQDRLQTNCGQRSISFLLFCQKFGVENALKL